MPASDRGQRKIVFQATAAAQSDEPVTHIELYLLEADAAVLLRVAVLAGRLQATLTGKDDRLDALLDAFEEFPAAAQFRRTGGAVVADSYDIAPGQAPALTACATRVGGLIIEMDARTVVGEPMDTRITPVNPTMRYQLPDDLFAVTHVAWRPLTTTDHGWSSSLRVPVREPKRSQRAKSRFATMAADVHQFLSRPPTDYQRQVGGRRRRLYLRRLVPVLTCVMIIASLPLLDRYVLGGDTAMHPGFLSLPPLLMIGAFALTWRDTPRIEIPPWPRALGAKAWPERPPSEDDTRS